MPRFCSIPSDPERLSFTVHDHSGLSPRSNHDADNASAASPPMFTPCGTGEAARRRGPKQRRRTIARDSQRPVTSSYRDQEPDRNLGQVTRPKPSPYRLSCAIQHAVRKVSCFQPFRKLLAVLPALPGEAYMALGQ